ncbi:MAG: hypothetical protein KCHDKBKB_02057 [Elusimicrobia bacterium]|nr:hypothetical protein [Elusimicrobiota bacterium]
MPWWRSRWFKNLILVLTGVLGVYGIVLVDVVLRAKESYQQAEKYLYWHDHPEAKKAFFDKKFEKEKKLLEESISKKKLPESEFQAKLETLEFDRDYNISESSLKYAYQYFKDTYELFTPPESSWVKKARVKTPEVLEMWKQELREQKIPYEDTFFD